MGAGWRAGLEPGALGHQREACRTDRRSTAAQEARGGMALARAWKQMSWLYYQYLLVTALYMLEPWERTVFSILPGRGRGGGVGGDWGGILPDPGPGGWGPGAQRRHGGHCARADSPFRGGHAGRRSWGRARALPRLFGAEVGGSELSLGSQVACESLDPGKKRGVHWKKSPRVMANLARPRLYFGRACLWFCPLSLRQGPWKWSRSLPAPKPLTLNCP